VKLRAGGRSKRAFRYEGLIVTGKAQTQVRVRGPRR
jgi:hypothetical protein